MKNLFIISAAWLGLSILPSHAEWIGDEAREYNDDLLIFTGELDYFVEQAHQYLEKDNAAKERIYTILEQTSHRIADVYFKEATPELKEKLDQYLKDTLQKNKDIRALFVVLGNGFAKQALSLIEQRRVKEKKIRKWLTGVGLVVSTVIGGFYFIRHSPWPKYTHAPNMYDIGPIALAATKGIIIIVTGTGVGYVAGSVIAATLPVDLSLKNAIDFAVRYPHGGDFIKDLEKTNSDLLLSLAEIEDFQEE